jgi:spermidine/putrescine transport system permease protein
LKPQRFRRLLWVTPLLLWFVCFLVVPLLFVLVDSFSERTPHGAVSYVFTLENYKRALSPLYMRVFWNSLKLAFLTVVSCFLMGYPMAFWIANSPFRTRLMTLVMVPFWTNFVVRAFATKTLLTEYGPINMAFMKLGLTDQPIAFLNHDGAIWLGMVSNYLPLMILPIVTALDRFDFSLLEAAKDLGAATWRIWLEILLPLTRHGILSGCVFVFAPALGEFVIPDLLGGARTLLIGNVVTEQFLKTRDWPFGSALSLLLILSTTIVYLFSVTKWARSSRSVKVHS